MKYFKLIFLILSLSACKGKQQPADEDKAPVNENAVTLTDVQMKNAKIVTGKMEVRKMSSILRLNGVIDVPPQNMVSVSVPLGGYLKSTILLPGMHVVKGQSIAVIQDQQYIQLQQDYLTAKAKMDYLKKEFQRQKELNPTQASSDKLLQQSESDFRSQHILITSLAEKLKLAGINVKNISDSAIQGSVAVHSPIDGYVSKVNVNIGKYVAPTEVLFELINPDDIHLALSVFEKDLDKLYIGQPLIAFTNNDTGKKYKCEILLIGKQLTQDRNTEVHCHFEAYHTSLIPGTYMNAEVEVKNLMSHVMPSDAVVRFENKEYLYTMQTPNQFEMVEVQTGISHDGFIEITSPSGEDFLSGSFVLHGAYALLMMMKNTSDD